MRSYPKKNGEGLLRKLAATAGSILIAAMFVINTSAAPGDLDPTFGAGGKVTTKLFRSDPYASSGAAGVVIQPDGKIVTAGITTELVGVYYFSYIVMARYNTDGSLDQSFGNGGKIASDVAGTQVEINALVLQPDGKFLLGGLTFLGSPVGTNNGANFAVVRFNQNGTLDTSFGAGGLAIADYSGGTTNDDVINGLALQPDGKIVAAGYARMGEYVDLAVARFNPNGSLDASFGTNGKVSTTLSPTSDLARAVRLQTDGKIVAVGYAFTSSNFDYALVRYDINGSLDASFGTNGRVFTDFGDARSDTAYAALIQSDGKIVAGGSAQTPGGAPSDFALARYNTDGSLDTGFGTGGKTTTDFLGLADRIHALVLQTNGKIAAAGYATVPASSSHTDFALARFNANGSIDSTFGTNGKTTTNFVNAIGEDRAFALVLQADGKLVAAGFGTTQPNTSSIMALVRYIGDPPIAPRNKPFDFDGDGKADISIFRPTGGEWWIQRSSGGIFALQFGSSTDRIVSGDYTGDGKTDVAVWRPASGEWFILRSEDSSFYAFPFGTDGDIPVPADFDGDGRADAAVFRPSNSVWYIQKSSGGVSIQTFGQSGDKPIAADFDGDSKDDISIFRPQSGEWWIQRSSTNAVYAVQFGGSTDITVPADYTGDGKADIAVFRPATGEWLILRSEDNSYYGFPFGINGDNPVPADYDGDGKSDAAVFRNGVWYLQRTSQGYSVVQFGLSTDVPVPTLQ